MVKTLLLMRHGKSDWDAEYGEDFDRPLAKRGRQAAKRVGRFLARRGEVPDRVLTSSAVRARDTVARVMAVAGWSCPVEEARDLYEAAPETVLRRIHRCPDEATRLLVAGHEPTWSMLTSALIGGASVRFPTAAVARIDFEVARWRQVSFGRGTLVWLVTPKLLATSAT